MINPKANLNWRTNLPYPDIKPFGNLNQEDKNGKNKDRRNKVRRGEDTLCK